MRKLLILAGAVVFLAAACNSETAINQTTNPPPTQSSTQASASAKIDATVNALDKNVDSETSVNMQSDSDIVSSDESIINSYNGAANASTY